MITAYLATDTKVSPTALEIIQRVKKDTLGDDVKIRFAPAHDRMPDGVTVFALGKYRPENPTWRVVPAPSVPQICSRADIVTRLGQSFMLLAEPPVLPEYRYEVLDLDRTFALCGSIRHTAFAFDIETSGVANEDRPEYDAVISVAIYAGKTAYVIPEEVLRTEGVQQAIEAMLMADNGIVTVNGKFDLSYFPGAVVPPEKHFDVQLASYSLFPALGEHGLKPNAKRLFGFEDWDADKEQYLPSATYDAYEKFEDGSWHAARKYPRKNGSGSGYERIPREILYKYNGFDVYATWWWYKRTLEKISADPDALRAFEHLTKLSNLFMGVEKRGIRLDIPYLEGLSKTLHVEKAEAEAKLNEVAGREVNPRSPKQVKEWFIEQGMADLTSTDEKTMTKLIEDHHEDEEYATVVGFARQLLVCRDLSKQLGTYVDGYKDQADHLGRVYPGYKLIASITGRLGGQGASMLTIPRDKRLKKMVLADDGEIVVGADLSQAELRVMACESMDPWLIAAFQPGSPDFFDQLLGQAYPDRDWVELHRLVNDHLVDEDLINFYNDSRAGMKATIYGASFNRGVKAIAAQLKIPRHEAQVLMDAFIRPGSEFDLWRQEVQQMALRGEQFVTKFGRHFQSELVTRKNRHLVINSATAFPSQSTANDICLLATLEVEPKLKDFGHHLMGTVHDAIYTSGPEETAEQVGALLTETLAWAGRETYGDIVPFAADWGHGPSMADA